MGTAIALAIIAVAVALIYWAPLKRLRTALGVAHLLGTGHAFLLLGVAIGLALGEEHDRLSLELTPIVGFVAGWVGFAAGLRFDRRVLNRLPARAWVAALLPAVAAAVVVGGASVAILLAAGVPTVEALAASLILAASAASSGPTLVAVLRTRRAGRDASVRANLKMIELSAGLDDLVVIVLAILAFSLLRPVDEAFTHIVFALVSIGGGALLGVVTWLFLGGRASDDERLLLGLGMLLFSAGCAAWLHLSPASVTACVAITLVNLPGDRGRQLFEAIRRVERPAVVILMTVIGFDAVGALHWVALPLLGAATLLRMLAKFVAGEAVKGPIPGNLGIVAGRGWSMGLVPQGTLGLVVAVTFYGVWHDATARSVLAAIAGAAILNELVAPWLLWRTVRDSAATPRQPTPVPGDDGGAA